MNYKNQRHLLFGILFFLIPAYSFSTWIYVFGSYPNYASRISAYEKLFPLPVQEPLFHGAVVIACAALAIVFLLRLHNLSTPAAILKYALIVISSLLIMFNLWSLM